MWALVVLCLGGAGAAAGTPVPAPIAAFRAMLGRFEKNATVWAATARAARAHMAAHDPDYPLYHLAPVEGWLNDPNGVTHDPRSGLLHRFYQWDKTYGPDCMHGRAVACQNFSFGRDPHVNARAWGHTVSNDLAFWQDWPGIDSDSEWDQKAVWSGNCALVDDGTPVCIYSGGKDAPCDTGVCAASDDWINWRKSGCMRHAPSPRSQVNHDSAIVRLPNRTWLLLSGGCTYSGNGSNVPVGPCAGNAQVWTAPDLARGPWTYRKALTQRGGPGNYWELPYLLPFDADGAALRNDQIGAAATTALLFGEAGNPAWVGDFNDTTATFVPRGADGPVDLDSRAFFYSFNPHATDVAPDTGATRRLMFGWVLGPTSAAVGAGAVPYWQSLHSVPRALTVVRGGESSRSTVVAQAPVPELARLRVAGSATTFSNITVAAAGGGGAAAPGGFLPAGAVGGGSDSVEVVAVFGPAAPNVTSFGVRLRMVDGWSCDIAYNPQLLAVSAGPPSSKTAWWPVSQGGGRGGGQNVTLHIFLDRSVVEVFADGAALTGRCLLPAGVYDGIVGTRTTAAAAAPPPPPSFGADLFAEGSGDVTLVRLDAWAMGTMWKTEH